MPKPLASFTPRSVGADLEMIIGSLIALLERIAGRIIRGEYLPTERTLEVGAETILVALALAMLRTRPTGFHPHHVSLVVDCYLLNFSLHLFLNHQTFIR